MVKLVYWTYFLFRNCLDPFSQQYNPCNTQSGYENKGNDHQPKIFLIDKQILFVSTLGNV